MKKTLYALALCSLFSPAIAEEKVLDPVLVTATRYELSNLDIPSSVNKLNLPELGLKLTAVETLVRVPGLAVVDTAGADLKISNRGFGSRANFGSRGVLIYKDGIPVSVPDGFGTTAILDLNTIGSVEVLRGPFSVLYGTSSNAVVNFITEEPTKPAEVSGSYVSGSFNTTQTNTKYSGITGSVKYMINQTKIDTDGYRAFSKNSREQNTVKLWIDSIPDTRIELGVDDFSSRGQDYGNGNGGVTLSRFQTDPYSVEPAVYNINSYRIITQTGTNLKISRQLEGDNFLMFAVYGGQRYQEQITPTTQSSTLATTSSGLFKTSRDLWGMEKRFDHGGQIAGKKYKVSVGLSVQSMNDFVTTGRWMTNGVQFDGKTLTRSANQQAMATAQYVQGRVELTDQLDLHAGIRHTTTTMDFVDHLTTVAFGGDNSGGVKYNNIAPSVGVIYKLQPTTSLYASYAQGAENPSFTETQNATAVSTTRPNTSLRQSTSDNYEMGIKSWLSPQTYVAGTVFYSKTADEIVIVQNVPGFRVFGNQGDTTRQGVELEFDTQLPKGFRFYTALSYNDAKFDSTNLYIPAVPRTLGFAEFSWSTAPKNLKIAVEAVHSGKIFGETDNSISNDGYTVYNFRTTAKQKFNKLTVTEYFAVNNLMDTVYVANLRTAAQFGRYYDTGVARNIMIGINAAYAF
jgi:iron complex outermembrane recepter protein